MSAHKKLKRVEFSTNLINDFRWASSKKYFTEIAVWYVMITKLVQLKFKSFSMQVGFLQNKSIEITQNVHSYRLLQDIPSKINLRNSIEP